MAQLIEYLGEDKGCDLKWSSEAGEVSTEREGGSVREGADLGPELEGQIQRPELGPEGSQEESRVSPST